MGITRRLTWTESRRLDSPPMQAGRDGQPGTGGECHSGERRGLRRAAIPDPRREGEANTRVFALFFHQPAHLRLGAKPKAEHSDVPVPRRNRHDARSDHVERPVDRVQCDLRNRADRGRFIKNISECPLQRGDGFQGRIYGQGRFLPQIKRANIVKPENVIGMRMREKNRVEPSETHAHRLESEIGVVSITAVFPSCTSRIEKAAAVCRADLWTAHRAMARERRHAHGCAGSKHRKLEYGMRCCRQGGDPRSRSGLGLLLLRGGFRHFHERQLQVAQHVQEESVFFRRQIPLRFSRSTSSMSIISRAPSRSSTGCPVRGSAYPPSSMAAFCPSDRIKFSNTGDRFGASAGGTLRRNRARRRLLSASLRSPPVRPCPPAPEHPRQARFRVRGPAVRRLPCGILPQA